MNAGTAQHIFTHLRRSVPCTIYDTKWIPSSARFVAIGAYPRQTGTIQVFGLNKGQLEKHKEFEKNIALKCGTFGASTLEDRHLATGAFDGQLAVYDLEHEAAPIFMTRAHNKIINSIDGAGGLNMKGPPEIVTGSRDGCVKIWDTRQRDKPVTSLEPEDSSESRDCWAVSFGNSFNNEERIVAAGYDNGDIKLLDLRMNSVRWEANVKNGICNIEFDRKDIAMNKMLVTTLEGKFSVFDMKTQHPSEGFASTTERGLESTMWCGKHMPQNRDVFMTCGTKLWLYSYSYPKQRCVKDSQGKLKGVPGTVKQLNYASVSAQPVCSLDWNRDKEGLACAAAYDQSVQVIVVTGTNLI
eukprot:gb/GECH01003168.1/.p1 GENE.gb/GECH01003168.1/~~gb/GECH01003168.1/.p1  ORF type:complete len:355 (+),score=84.66 gb/GECH01003168.1/:1-1065(+)